MKTGTISQNWENLGQTGTIWDKLGNWEKVGKKLLFHLLRSMQREDFPLSLYRHPARQLLVHVVNLFNKRAEAGRATRFIKVQAHRGEPLKELADSLAAAAAEADTARSVALDQDPDAVYFLLKETWVEWDARVREDLVQPPTLPLTAS